MFFSVLCLISSSAVFGELRQVQVLFRHGDRAPSGAYPNDPHGADAWPRGFSQLTEQGYAQAQELGEFLRWRYGEEVPKMYNKKEVHVRSSDKDRCIETAMGVVSTLFAGQVVPVHTYSNHWEDLLLKPNSVRCPRAERLERRDKTLLHATRNTEYYELFEFISQHSGMLVDMGNVADIFNSVYREHANGLQQPSWVFEKINSDLNVTVFDHILELKRQDRMESFNSFEKSRLRTGFLVGQITKDLMRRAAGLSQKKLELYATHDATVTSLMYSLGVSNDLLPPYVATLLFELHELNSQHYVKLLYRNSTHVDPYTLELPGCEALCPLEKFQALMAPRSIESRKQHQVECAEEKAVEEVPKRAENALNVLDFMVYGAAFAQALFVFHKYYSSISKQYR